MKTNLTILSDSRNETILTCNLNAKDSIGTFNSATLGKIFFLSFIEVLLLSYYNLNNLFKKNLNNAFV